MLVVDHKKLGGDEWRPGVRSRAWATAADGARQVRIAEQVLAPGNKAPMHWHYFEENITIIGGRGRFTVDGETVELGPANTVIVPSMAVHGFDSIGDEPLHIIAAMAWPINEAYYVDDPYAVYRAGETLGTTAAPGDRDQLMLLVPSGPASPSGRAATSACPEGSVAVLHRSRAGNRRRSGSQIRVKGARVRGGARRERLDRLVEQLGAARPGITLFRSQVGKPALPVFVRSRMPRHSGVRRCIHRWASVLGAEMTGLIWLRTRSA